MSNESFFDVENIKDLVGGGAGIGLAIAFDRYILQPYAERTKQMNAATNLLTELDTMEKAFSNTKLEILNSVPKNAEFGWKVVADIDSKAAAKVLAQKALNFSPVDIEYGRTRPEAWSAFAKAHGGEKVIDHLKTLKEEGAFKPIDGLPRANEVVQANSLGIKGSSYSPTAILDDGLLDKFSAGRAADRALNNIGEMATAIDWDKELGSRGVFSRSILNADPENMIKINTIDTYRVPSISQSIASDLASSEFKITPKVRSAVGTYLGNIPETLATERVMLRPLLLAGAVWLGIDAANYFFSHK